MYSFWANRQIYMISQMKIFTYIIVNSYLVYDSVNKYS